LIFAKSDAPFFHPFCYSFSNAPQLFSRGFLCVLPENFRQITDPSLPRPLSARPRPGGAREWQFHLSLCVGLPLPFLAHAFFPLEEWWTPQPTSSPPGVLPKRRGSSIFFTRNFLGLSIRNVYSKGMSKRFEVLRFCPGFPFFPRHSIRLCKLSFFFLTPLDRSPPKAPKGEKSTHFSPCFFINKRPERFYSLLSHSKFPSSRDFETPAIPHSGSRRFTSVFGALFFFPQDSPGKL